MTARFMCDHSFEPENQVSIGGARVGCKTCRNAARYRRLGLQPAPPDKASSNPDRILLRRFSWEDGE